MRRKEVVHSFVKTIERVVKRVAVEERPFAFLVSRFLWSSRLCKLITFQMPGDYWMRFYPSSISTALWLDRRFRSEDSDFVRSVLREGETFVDVGANVGQLSLVAACAVGEAGSVIAIEPHPRTFSYLVGNTKLNPFGIKTVNVALGRSDGEVSFADMRSDDQNFVVRASDHGRVVRVSMTTLDKVSGNRPIDLLKIDVEGLEIEVLAGGADTLRRTRCIFIEDSDSNLRRFNASSRDLRDSLRACGFELFVLDDGTLSPELENASQEPTRSVNLVGVRSSFMEELLARTGLRRL